MILAAIVAPASHVFTFRPTTAVKSVSLAGSFNGWNKDADPMVRQPDGIYRLARTIPAGSHRYKFVIDGASWVTDPAAKSEDDGNGNVNSVLLIAPAGFERAAKLGDARVTEAGLAHDPKEAGPTYDRGRLTLRLRTRVGDAKGVKLHFRRPNATMCEDYPMAVAGRDEFYQYWTRAVDWDRKGAVRYAFLLQDGGKDMHYAAGKVTKGPENWYRIAPTDFRPFVTPAWVPGTVVYQIFPDRFENGDPSNDPKDVESWTKGVPTYSNRFGGDAAGLRKRAGYLADLGIGTVYLNPVFASPSNHRYDTSDYRRIDPEIGTNAEFGQATAALKARGIRTVLDIAFNHTATDSPWFMDLRTEGEKSRYRSWYYPKSFPIEVKENPNYEAWYGFPSMPKLNTMNPETTRELLSLPAYWRRSYPGVEGLRLDVANEVDERFWRAFRTRVKAEAPGTWIIGEEWGDASRWLKGDQWDAQMNYPFREATIGFLATGKTGARAYWDSLVKVTDRVAPQVARAQMNLLGSHDVPRWATVCPDRKLADLGVLAMFGWVGAPTIYYGDELGMEGGKDPDNRRAMRWDLATEGNPTLRLHKRLIAARRVSRALQEGEARLLSVAPTDDALSFERRLGKDRAVVALNRAAVPRTVRLALDGAYRDALTGQILKNTISHRLGPKQGLLLLPIRTSSSAPLSR